MAKIQKIKQITVKTTLAASIAEVWEKFTQPEHIMAWNQASPDWHCPAASSDLREGGTFSYTMAAKDGSFSFDLMGAFDVVKQQELLEYTLVDGRKVTVQFKQKGKKVEVIETFEAENENPYTMQKAGWQAILNSFKKSLRILGKARAAGIVVDADNCALRKAFTRSTP